jgi:hypothetical protein
MLVEVWLVGWLAGRVFVSLVVVEEDDEDKTRWRWSLEVETTHRATKDTHYPGPSTRTMRAKAPAHSGSVA